MKVEPLQEQVPQSLLRDPQAEAYFTRLHRWAREMWERTGGGSDAIEDNLVQSLRQPARSTSLADMDHFNVGYGAPSNSMGNNNDFYFRLDGTTNTVLYHKESGSWVAIA